MLVFIEEGYRDAYARGRRPVRVRATQIRPLLVGQCRNKPIGLQCASRAAYGFLGAFLHGAQQNLIPALLPGFRALLGLVRGRCQADFSTWLGLEYS